MQIFKVTSRTAETGQHASACECCTATGYAWLAATLQCADGSTALHRVRTPAQCACRACGASAYIKNGNVALLVDCCLFFILVMFTFI